jgi:hypothetical protein
MNNYIKAFFSFFGSVAVFLATILTFLLVLYFGYMALVVSFIILIIYLIKQLYDAKDMLT